MKDTLVVIFLIVLYFGAAFATWKIYPYTFTWRQRDNTSDFRYVVGRILTTLIGPIIWAIILIFAVNYLFLHVN